MSKPSLLLGTLAVLAAVALGAGAAMAGPDAWFRAGEAYGVALSDEAVVANVDTVPLTAAELRIGQAMIELGNESSPTKRAVDARSVLEDAIGRKSLVAAAIRRGLEPSPQDVDAHIAEVRDGFRDAPDAARNLDQFLAGMGMTADQYFTSPFARARYAENLAISRLRADVIGGVDQSVVATRWQQFEATTRAAATVEILDPALR